MNCPKCGVAVPTGATFCRECGYSLVESPGQGREESSQGMWATQAGSSVAYAGFWLRLAAYLIDSLLLGVLTGVFILLPLLKRAGISTDNPWVLFTQQSRQISAINLLVGMVAWVYWAVLESSAWQATLGKRHWA